MINGEKSIMKEIINNGPVTALIQLKKDFYAYETGIYKSKTLDPSNEYHTIEIIGWGFEKNQSYWLAQNSYGNNWGNKGFFKIIRGINHLGIEEYTTAADPLIQ